MPIDTLNCPFCEVKIELGPGITVKECPSCHKKLHVPVGHVPRQSPETGIFKLEEISKPPTQSFSPLPSLQTSTQNLGPYRIERNIGRGGMGFVYEATDTRLNRRIALKTIESGNGIDEVIINRFRREAQSAARLRHPNIVSVHDVGQSGGFDYFTMDLVEGMTLDKWIQATQATLKDRVRILEKVSRALDYAHQQGVIHRDVKPGNIMIDSSSEPQIMDFGLARNTRDSANLTLSGSIVGTPAYMAPEQTMGSSSEVGAKTDIWALGVVAYEVLTGKPPFDTGNVYQTIYAVLHNEPESPRKLNPDIPRDLETIILKCLEKQVGRRYENAKLLADDLQSWREDRPIGIRGTPWWEKWIKKLTQKKDISMDEFVLEQQARQRAESQRLELQSRVESDSRQEWRLVFEENFNSPDIQSRWEIYGGDWEIKNGELRLWGGSPQIMYLKKEITGDVRIEFECHQETPLLSDVSCFTHAILLNNRLKACETGYMYQYGASSNIRSFIERPGKRLWDKLHSPLIRGERYRVKVEKSGNKLTFQVNDLLVCEIEDDEPLFGAERTSLGLYGWRAETFYSSFKVYQLGAPVKGDLLEIANRQLDKGRFDSAIDLFQEIIESSEDPLRIQQARQRMQWATLKQKLKQNFPSYQETISRHWPKAKFELNDKGLILDISSMKVSDLSPVTGMPLDQLEAIANQIKNLDPLQGMPLSNVNLHANQVETLEIFRGCHTLKSLNITQNLVQDLEPLGGLTLETLAIGHNPIKNTESIANISIGYLACQGLQLKNIEFIRGKNLLRLSCRSNAIQDLGPLQGMPLRILQCDHNQIQSLEALRGMALHIVNIDHNQIQSLDPLRGAKMAELRCSGNPFTTLEPFFDDPPSIFMFDCATLSPDELERAATAWEKSPATHHHATNARSLKALRTEDAGLLKKLATRIDGNSYLQVQKTFTWIEASRICEKFGGALFTPENEEEVKMLARVAPQIIPTWLNCIYNHGSIEWLRENSHEESLKSPIPIFGHWNGRKISSNSSGRRAAFLIKWKK